MEFKKCERCGCFFTTTNNVCENCAPKDNMELSKLRNYFNGNINCETIDNIAVNTGISVKNLNRYLANNNEFSGMYNNNLNLNNNNQGNISINL